MEPLLGPMRLRSADRAKRGRAAATENDGGVADGGDGDSATKEQTDRSWRLAKRTRGAAERGDCEAQGDDRDGKGASRGGGDGGDDSDRDAGGGTDAETSDDPTSVAERKDLGAAVASTTDSRVQHSAPLSFVEWVERIRFVSERVADPRIRKALQDYGCRNAGAHVDAYLREYERTSRVQMVQGACDDCGTEVEFEAEFEHDRVEFPPQYGATEAENADIGDRIRRRVDRTTTALMRRMLVREIRQKHRRADARYLLRPLMLEFAANTPQSAVCAHIVQRSRTLWRRESVAFRRTVADEWRNRSHATPLDARMCAATFALMCRQFVNEIDLFALACVNRATWRYVRTRAFTPSGRNLCDRYTHQCPAVGVWLRQSARRRYALAYGESESPAALPLSSSEGEEAIVCGEQPGVRQVTMTDSLGTIRFPDAESIVFRNSVRVVAATLSSVAPQPLRHIAFSVHERGVHQMAGEVRWVSGPAYEMKALRFAYLHCRRTIAWDELVRAATINGCRHMVIDHTRYDHERLRVATYLADFADCTTERRHAAILRQCKIIVRRHHGVVSLTDWHSNSVGWHERRTLYTELERDFETRAVVGVPLWIDVADPRVPPPPAPPLPLLAAAAATQV